MRKNLHILALGEKTVLNTNMFPRTRFPLLLLLLLLPFSHVDAVVSVVRHVTQFTSGPLPVATSMSEALPSSVGCSMAMIRYQEDSISSNSLYFRYGAGQCLVYALNTSAVTETVQSNGDISIMGKLIAGKISFMPLKKCPFPGY